MDPNTELEFLRERNDTQAVQIETLQEHLNFQRTETARLADLVNRLERLVDEKNAEIARLTQAIGSNY